MVEKENKQIKVALCCMAKKENLYLREWVEYHLEMGFTHIFIYDNNDINEERCETPIGNFINSGLVTVVDYRGKKQTSCQIQVSAYQDFYNKNQKDYDWIMFLDVDEFLVLKKHASVQEYLSEKVFENVKDIRINWLCYGDNNFLHYENKPVRERFTELCENKEVNKYYKNFIKTGIQGLKIGNVHYTSKIDPVALNNGTIIPYSSSTVLNVTNHDWAYIAHYVTKSTEEFINIKRRRRGEGFGKTRLNMDFYWRYNKKTPEKIHFLKENFK